jgi:VWFA-related protein
MRHRVSLKFLLALSLIAPASLQSQQQPQQQRPPQRTPPAPQKQTQTPDADDVVRITTNLVQVDAVVVDGNGRHVSELRAEDFEILEDGRKQPITNFSYVRTARPVASPAPSSPAPATVIATSGKDGRRDKLPAPPVPPVIMRPEQTRRITVLAVDDMGLSFESLTLAQRALRKFVDEQLQPDDMIAIVRTGSGTGTLQQLTSDKRRLHAAIDSLRWNPRGRGGINPIVPGVQHTTQDRAGVPEEAGGAGDGRDTMMGLNDRISSVASLEALAYFVRGLRELPGRKSIVVLSDNIPTRNRNGENIVDTEMRRLIDLANRSSVTFYGIDPRGLPTLGVEAADEGICIGSPGCTGPRLSQMLNGNDPRIGPRRSSFYESQDGLNHLSRQTGGFALFNSNDLPRSFGRVFDDQVGYYLIGYRPDERTFDAKTGVRSFRSLQINVPKRPDLKVRSRSGFYGSPERDEQQPVTLTRDQQLVNALSSPFASGGVNLRLTALFGNEAVEGSFMRSMLYIDTRNLTFTPEADGWQKAVIDVLAVVFNADGSIAEQANRTHTLRARGETYERVLKGGIVYTLNVPVRRPGAYQLRFAVRDAATDRIGTANEFVEVPDVNRKRLSLSGLVAAAAGGNEAEADPQTGPAVRHFERGMRMDFGYIIYNARLDKASNKPQLTTQVRLFRGGQQLFASPPEPYDAGGQQDLRRLVATGRLRLGGELTPGDYVLQVVVTDALAERKEQMATQWIDFKLVK